MTTYDYYVIDVFTSERFRGNPLAVVFTDSDLSLTSYENISREFGYSETSFIYYSKPDKALKVRSFTPAGFEVGGAGHNLLGAVYAALIKGLNIFHEQDDKLFVIMKDERIRLSIDHLSNNSLFTGMLQKPALVERNIDPAIIAEALSMDLSEISVGNLVPAVVKTEVTHLLVPLKSLAALNKIIPNKDMLIKIADRYNFEGVYCFTVLNTNKEYFAQARFFNPGMGIDEDPATGSAAGPLAGYLEQVGHVQRNVVYQLLQGQQINHPSVLRFEVTREGVWISGHSTMVMQGTIYY